MDANTKIKDTPTDKKALGALGLAADPFALIDHRYLWDDRGNLLLQHTQQQGQLRQQDTYAYDSKNQLLVNLRSQVQQATSIANAADKSKSALGTNTGNEQQAANQSGTESPSIFAEQAIWRYGYDAHQRRLLSQEANTQSELIAGTTVSNYGIKKHQLLSVLDRGSSATNSARAHSGGDSNEMGSSGFLPSSHYNLNGQPLQSQGREYTWDALGRLSRVVDHNTAQTAHYQYDHRGLRNAKLVYSNAQLVSQTAQISYMVYNGENLQVELNAKGKITREYIYLGQQAIALIDIPSGISRGDQGTVLGDVMLDIYRAIKSIFINDTAQLVWLHSNHLGAIEAASDAQGQLIWQADYAPFGQANTQMRTRIQSANQNQLSAQTQAQTKNTHQNFILNLRLPGQYYDAETGLHYNQQRYYNPSTGSYLTPDPLGTPNGENPYAYVAHNPLRYIDPNGLVLFAFDGTGNTNDPDDLRILGNGYSNVWRFNNLYNDGATKYISGVGTIDKSDPKRPITPSDYSKGTLLDMFPGVSYSQADMGGNYSGYARIQRMIEYFKDAATAVSDDEAMDVDIIGFSRGAAQARDFANYIALRTNKNGYYEYFENINGQGQFKCQKVNLRFMGLWDTVLSENRSGHDYQLAIPSGFQYVAHAVALNEYRGHLKRGLPGSTGSFPLESILGSPKPTAPNSVRIEKGFIGAHADIGGGFPESQNDLSQVALAWMVQQAREAGVKMNLDASVLQSTTANPVIHDKSDNQYCVEPEVCLEDREIRYMDGETTTQTKMAFSEGITYSDTAQFINYYDNYKLVQGIYDKTPHKQRIPEKDFSIGTVNMAGYLEWLGTHGYNLGNLEVQ